MDAIREQIVTLATAELGPQNADKYWSDVLPNQTGYPKSWCGGFCLWVLHQAGLAKDIDWRIGLGFCYRLHMTTKPEAGDIAYFDKPYQHHAIVVSIDNDMLTTIDGNQAGETVKQRVRMISESKPVFYSIESLLVEPDFLDA